MPRKYTPDEFSALFWSKVDKGRNPDACWSWQARRNAHGYGSVVRWRRLWLAHRLAYEMTVGPIPNAMHVLHRCDNPACVNPAHLFLGTQADNVRDMVAKGRKVTASGEKAGGSKLTVAQVQEIRSRRTDGETLLAIANDYGISDALVSYIANRKAWKHVT